MALRAGYFARETLISLRRNILMTLAGILTVAVSLLLFGVILLFSQAVDNGTERWKGGVEFELFMFVEATDNEIADVDLALTEDPDVARFEFLDHDEAFAEFGRIFQDDPSLLENIRPEDLPVSFRVVPVDPELTQDIVDRNEGLAGVDKAVTADEQVQNVLNATRVLRLGIYVLSGALLLASLFLIVNTIRLATFARRREIEVMKLVGAGNWFVRVPFMAEGLVQGAVGAGIAFGGVYLVQVAVFGNALKGHRNDLLEGFYATSSEAILIGILCLVIGAVIGIVGSLLGLRKYLNV